MMKPVVEGRMLQAHRRCADDSVLEIGTGSRLPHRLPGAPRRHGTQRRTARRLRRCRARAPGRGECAQCASGNADAVQRLRSGAAVRRDGCHWRRARAAATLARLDQARRPPVRGRRRLAGAARDAVHARRGGWSEQACSKPICPTCARRTAAAFRAVTARIHFRGKCKNVYESRLTALAAALACAASPAGAEDLMQIYDQARPADPTLRHRRRQPTSRRRRRRSARAALLPQISASLNYLHSDGNAHVGPLINQRYRSAGNRCGGQRDIRIDPVTLAAIAAARPRVRLSQSLFNWSNIERWRSARATRRERRQRLRRRGAGTDRAHRDGLFRRAHGRGSACVRAGQREGARAPARPGRAALPGRPVRDHRRTRSTRAITTPRVAQVITAQNNVDNLREAISQITGKNFGELKKLREQLPLEKPEPPELESVGRYRAQAESADRFARACARRGATQRRGATRRTLSDAVGIARAQRHAGMGQLDAHRRH